MCPTLFHARAFEQATSKRTATARKLVLLGIPNLAFGKICVGSAE